MAKYYTLAPFKTNIHKYYQPKEKRKKKKEKIILLYTLVHRYIDEGNTETARETCGLRWRGLIYSYVLSINYIWCALYTHTLTVFYCIKSYINYFNTFSMLYECQNNREHQMNICYTLHYKQILVEIRQKWK